jgi:alpha-1,2-mannosyltransferase
MSVLRTVGRELYVRVYAIAMVATALTIVVFVAGYFADAKFPYDAGGYLIGRDFVNAWMAGRAVLTGHVAAWFDYEAYNVALRELFGTTYWKHNWSYPPHLLLFVWPLGFIGYFPGLVIWTALGIGLYLFAGSEGFTRRDRLALLALSPALFINVLTGQNGCFTAALLIGGLINLDRRPVLAGVLFGILTIKPQLGVLLPIMLLLTGRWRVIAAAVTTAAFLVVVSALVFGLDAWIAYIEKALPMQRRVLMEITGLVIGMMPTVFMNLRILDVSSETALMVQTAVAVAVVVAVVWTYWQCRDPMLSVALLLTATFLVTPYAFNYDMVVFGWVVAMLRARDGNTPLDTALALALWTLPVTCMLLRADGWSGSALVLMAFAVRLLWKLAYPRALAEAGSVVLAVPAGRAAAA